jgi:hypothetical protein
MRSVRAGFALAIVLVTGCGPSSPATIDEALDRAVVEADFHAAVQLVRVPCLDRTCALMGRDQDPAGAIGLFVLDPNAPFDRRATSVQSVSGGPGTLGIMETHEIVYVYGRVNDGQIARLTVELMKGARTFDVTAPGYAVAYPASEGFPQGWAFLAADGTYIAGSRPRP